MTKGQTAAAPDLLSTLKKLRHHVMCGSDLTRAEFSAMMEEVDAAITQAEADAGAPAVSEASHMEAVEAARRIVVVADKWEANQISGQQYWHGLEGHLDAKSVIRLARALLSRASA